MTEQGELVAVSAEVIDTPEDDAHEALEHDDDGPDPSQLLEINQEEFDDSQEGWNGQKEVKSESPDEPEDEDEPKSFGLLQKALTMKRERPKSDDDSVENGVSPAKRQLSIPNPLLKDFLNNHPLPLPDDLNSLSDPKLGLEARRSLSQIVNSKPRQLCPICGDKANGIHYGIYTCEGCKNFFKRSVVAFTSGKPYVCRGNNDCNVSLFEDDGVTRRRTRCQACRYNACLQNGMVHVGRNGRQIYGPKSVANAQHLQAMSQESYGDDFDSSSNHNYSVDHGDEDLSNGFCRQQIDQLQLESQQNDIEILHSRVRELEAAVTEKNHQLQLKSAQITNLQKKCEIYESQLQHVTNGAGGGEALEKKTPPIQFGNGSVTITSIGKRSNSRKPSTS